MVKLKMHAKLFGIKFGVFFFLVLGVSIVHAFPTVNLGTDDTNDVEKISWAFTAYGYEKGNFHDEIDIVSLSAEADGAGNITMTLTCQGTPAFDGTHVYWIWIAFEAEGTQGSSPGAWFWAGGYEGTDATASWLVYKDLTNYTTYGTGTTSPQISGNSLSWETNEVYWDDLANSGSWEIEAWAWTSENSSFAAATQGDHYWDYYPDELSGYEDTSVETTDSLEPVDGDGTPGFDIAIPILVLPLLAVFLRKRKH